jgi:HEAT repeat protein
MDYDNTTDRQQPDLNAALSALSTSDRVLNSSIIYGLSGLEPADIERLAPVWEKLPVEYRRTLLRELVESSEANFELDYTALGNFALDDADAEVREAGIDLLWEDDSLELMNRLVEIMLYDEATAVRAAAASALGHFILLGELGDLPETETTKAQDAVVGVLNNLDEDVDVRRRALEAIANCGNEIVEDAIREAYDSPDHRMQISAVFAMGRTYDEQWSDKVLQQLDSDDPEMLYEAARAAGELELEDAVRKLTRLALDDDREVKEVAIWSLGEIGSKEAVRTLERLATDAKRTNDNELLEAIEDAIGTASLSSGSLYLLRLDDED